MIFMRIDIRDSQVRGRRKEKCVRPSGGKECVNETFLCLHLTSWIDAL